MQLKLYFLFTFFFIFSQSFIHGSSNDDLEHLFSIEDPEGTQSQLNSQQLSSFNKKHSTNDRINQWREDVDKCNNPNSPLYELKKLNSSCNNSSTSSNDLTPTPFTPLTRPPTRNDEITSELITFFTKLIQKSKNHPPHLQS